MNSHSSHVQIYDSHAEIIHGMLHRKKGSSIFGNRLAYTSWYCSIQSNILITEKNKSLHLLVVRPATTFRFWFYRNC